MPAKPPADADLRPIMPGSPVPGSRISVPQTVRAGELLQGQVPVGSTVWVEGQAVVVDSQGRFQYPVAADAQGSLRVQVKRPAPDNRPPMPLRVRIL